MSERIVRGHILSVLPTTEWHHCYVCGGCGYLDQPNSLSSDCPGTQAQTLRLNDFFKNKLDYREGKWVNLHAK